MIDWHFSRPALASEHLELLFDKGVSRLTFFGRRRIGKTEYLQRDLMPAAIAKGVVPVYCSFWENKDQPHLAFIRVIESALPEGRWKPKLKIGFQAALFEAAAEIERADRPKAALPGELTQAASLFAAWIKHLNGRPALVLLDEIQHLATSSQFATFAASLRTMLDMAPPTLRVVFTGSSLADLQRLFEDQKAPFFNFATVMDFPLLDRAFVDHLAEIHHRITGLRVAAEDLWGLFERIGRNAQILTGLVERLVLLRTQDWKLVWEEIEGDMFGENGWCERVWHELAQSDRVVYLRLLEGKDPFAEDSLQIYDRFGFSRGTAQQALRRLINRGLLHRAGHGRYQRLVPILDDWIRGAGVDYARILAPRGARDEGASEDPA